jgi:hypothetical protein
MAWMVFGTFFLVDGHAAWPWWCAWTAACVYDLWKENNDKANAWKLQIPPIRWDPPT